MDLVVLGVLLALWVVHWVAHPSLMGMLQGRYVGILFALPMFVLMGFLLHLLSEGEPWVFWRPNRRLVGPYSIVWCIGILLASLVAGMVLFEVSAGDRLGMMIDFVAGLVMWLGIFVLGMGFYLVAWVALLDGAIYDPKSRQVYRLLSDDPTDAFFFWGLAMLNGFMGSAFLTVCFVLACDVVKRSAIA